MFKIRFSLKMLLLGCFVAAILSIVPINKYRSQVMLPQWIEAKGGHVDRLHDKASRIEIMYSLSRAREEKLPDGTTRHVVQPAYIPISTVQAMKKVTDQSWNIFSGSGWNISHVALPIGEFDEDTIRILNSIESIEYVTVIGMQNITPPDEPYGIPTPDPAELERLRDISNRIDNNKLICEFKHFLKEDYIVYQ